MKNKVVLFEIPAQGTEWQSQSAIEAAKAVVMAVHAKSGFNPQELFARLGIEADIANYTAIDA